MKFICCIYLLLLTSICPAQYNESFWKQDTSRHIPEKSKIIYVKNASFKNACQALLNAGFVIDKKDNDLEFVETAHPAINESSTAWKPIITLRIKDSVTIIKTKFFLSTIKDYMDGVYNGKKGKPQKNAIVYAFMMAYKVAKEIGGEISYSE